MQRFARLLQRLARAAATGPSSDWASVGERRQHGGVDLVDRQLGGELDAPPAWIGSISSCSTLITARSPASTDCSRIGREDDDDVDLAVRELRARLVLAGDHPLRVDELGRARPGTSRAAPRRSSPGGPTNKAFLTTTFWAYPAPNSKSNANGPSTSSAISRGWRMISTTSLRTNAKERITTRHGACTVAARSRSAGGS